MLKIFAAIVLGFLIGAACRWFEIPVPAPPRLIGALLVLSITLGYLASEYVLESRQTATAQTPAADEERS